MGRFHSAFCICSGSVAFSLNSLLTYIIFITRGSSVGKYKHLLFLYTLSAAIYASNQIVTAAEFAICSDGYVFYDTLNILPYPVALIFIENYTACFLEMIAIISWCFVYRYFVSLRAHNLDALHRHGRLLFLGSVCALAVMLSCSLYSTFPREEYYQELGPDFQNITGRELWETANNCGPLTVGGGTNLRLFWGLGQFVIFILLCAIINIFCAIRISLFLRKCFAESRTAMKRQTRIFTLLMLQFIFPLCLNLIPVFLVLIVPYLKISSYGLEYYVGAVSSIAQIIDPLLIFIFIHDYRVTLRNLLTRGEWRPSKTAALDYSASNNPSETTRRDLQKAESTENGG